MTNIVRNERGELKQSRQHLARCSNLVAKTPAGEPTIAPLLWSGFSVCVGFCLCLLGLLNFSTYERLLDRCRAAREWIAAGRMGLLDVGDVSVLRRLLKLPTPQIRTATHTLSTGHAS